MPGNSRHGCVVNARYAMLKTRYARDPNTYVGSDLFLYPTKDGRADALGPDLFVVFGVPDRERSSYKIWEEGKVPDFVLEVASPSTFKNDLERKKDAYERLGVREYCVFDPEGGMHWPRLQLFRLEAGVYEPVSYRGDPDGPMAVTSETLGLELRIDEDDLRLWDLEAAAFLAASVEDQGQLLEERAKRFAAEQRADQADQRADQADQRADQAQHEASQLRRETAQANQRADQADQRANQADQRADQANQRADQANQRADQADQRAELETQARRRAEAEIAKLKEQIHRQS